jgi:N-acetylglutamate synthase-like GNAT family acetyltransferase
MEISILPYQPAYQQYFERFNTAWLEKYFVVEPIDAYVLKNPEEALLKDGGDIMFAAAGPEIIGTVALKYVSAGVYELNKMAVDEAWQGKGAGKLLCVAAIEKARSLGAKEVILYSQSGLKAAIGIYNQLGFIHIPVDAMYKRADVKMRLLL